MVSTTRRRLITSMGALSVGSGLGISAPTVLAQGSLGDYPNRPIKIIVPLAAGGGGDLTARQLALHLTDRLGVPVVVENRPGAGGSIGTHAAIKSPPDGYTLVMLSSSHTCNAALRELPFDSINDIEPITLFKRESLILIGNKDLPVKSFGELVEWAKREPGIVTYGSSGVGGITHLSMEHLADLAGIKLNHVAYKGTGPALQDTIGGTVNLMFSSVAIVVPVVQEKRAIGLGIADARIPALPDVPSFKEAGVPGFKSDLWHAVAGPKGIPKEIVARLNKEMAEVLKSPQMQERIQSEGSQPVGGSPEQLLETISADIAQWKDVIRKADIKAT
ncbi:Bug family tripartite tricarboxylate transporter substrate binding protein [Parapusillimonas sp. JC17]|uniref:Bug family tripartite tricarboxylate transporter substrate binding protein n=1 Tax=Parapusillimonas sp. JC17 TaxID=3445768 RepID=UPI003F9FA254